MSATCSGAVKSTILSAGYLREYQSNHSIFLPDDIQSVIATFGKETYLHSIQTIHNSRDQIEMKSDTPDKITTSIPDASGEDIHSKLRLFCIQRDINPSLISKISDRNGGIKLISRGVCKNPNLFLYTHSHKLYRLSSSIRKIRINFILKQNDEIIDIKNGKDHTLFLTKLGAVYSYGANDSGQSGLGKQVRNVSRLTLVPFINHDKIISISCGKIHSMMVNSKNELLVCGYNYSGQLGIKNDKNKSLSDAYELTDSETETEDSETDEEIFVNLGLETYHPIVNQFFQNLGSKIQKIKCGLFHSVVMTTKNECYVFGNKVYCEDENVPYKLHIGSNKNSKIIDISCTTKHDLLVLYNN